MNLKTSVARLRTLRANGIIIWGGDIFNDRWDA